jgi:hypothetical protein
LVVDTVAGKEKPPADCVADRVSARRTTADRMQRIGNQIDTAMIGARSDFVSVL